MVPPLPGTRISLPQRGWQVGWPPPGTGDTQGGVGFGCLQHILLCCGVGRGAWTPSHQPGNKCVGEGGVAAVLVGMVGVGKWWLERGAPQPSEVLISRGGC